MPALPQLKADNRKLKADFTLLPLRLPSSPAPPDVQILPIFHCQIRQDFASSSTPAFFSPLMNWL